MDVLLGACLGVLTVVTFGVLISIPLVMIGTAKSRKH